MEMRNAAKWTEAMSDVSVDQQATKQSPNLLDDSHNRKSRDCPKLEALRQIYEQICTIRDNHAQIVADNAAKLAELQQRLEDQRKKMEELEAEHLETGRSMKCFSVDCDEQTAIMQKYRCEQEELQHQRHVLEDLEFQMFEVDAHYDEQKELIQQQLILKQQMISDVDKVYSAKNDCSNAPTMTSLSSQISCTNGDVDCLPKQNGDRLETEDDDCDEERYSYDSESEQTNTTASSAALATLADQQLQDHIDGEQEQSSNNSSFCQTDVTDACRQRECPSSSSFCRLPVPDLTLCVSQCRRQTSPVSPLSVLQDSDDCISSSCSDHCVTDIDETLTTLSRDAVKAQSLQQQADEVERRVSISRRLQFEQQPVDDDAIILRNRGAHTESQSRPLTRYLPVRGEPLDLLQFVEQAGHFVVRCAAHITVTSDSAAGFLVKMGGRIRTWRRRWFVFNRKHRQLVYYVDQSHTAARRTRKPKGCIDFSQIEDVFVFDRLSSVKSPAPDLTFCIKTTYRTFYVVAPSSEVRQLWMEIIFTGAEGYQEFF